jgi:hypothetical protein
MDINNTIYENVYNSVRNNTRAEESGNDNNNNNNDDDNDDDDTDSLFEYDNEQRLNSILRSKTQDYKVRVPNNIIALKKLNGDDESSSRIINTNNFKAFVRLNKGYTRLYLSILCIITINVSLFVALCVFRTFDSFSRTIAKNAALMTLPSLFGVLTTVGPAGESNVVDRNNGRTIHKVFAYILVSFSLTHTIAHIVLMYYNTDFELDLIIDYIILFVFQYVSGIIILLFLLLVLVMSRLSVRSKRYNTFYMVHVINVAIFVSFSGMHSPIFLTPLLIITCSWIYGSRLITRLSSNDACIICRHLNESFVIVDVRVVDNWLTRLMILRALEQEQGNATVWLSSKTLSCGLGRFERHPFSVIETYRENEYAYIRLMISNTGGDWVYDFHKRMVKNVNLDLFSNGISLVIDSMRSGIFRSNAIIQANHIVFILENVGISSFLGFLRFICDPKNRKIFHKRMRYIYLYYFVTNHNFLLYLNAYLNLCETIKCVAVKFVVYSPQAGSFRGSKIKLSERLNCKHILSDVMTDILRKHNNIDDDDDDDDENDHDDGNNSDDNDNYPPNVYFYMNSPNLRERTELEISRSNNRFKRKYRNKKYPEIINVNV